MFGLNKGANRSEITATVLWENVPLEVIKRDVTDLHPVRTLDPTGPKVRSGSRMVLKGGVYPM